MEYCKYRPIKTETYRFGHYASCDLDCCDPSNDQNCDQSVDITSALFDRTLMGAGH